MLNYENYTIFTLIEIAIVLVIIGLLLGGVLKGQEMINQAKIKNIAKDFDAVSISVISYRDRYNSLPGDDSGTARWTGTAVGNGNGTVFGDFNSGATTDESRLFWQHLRLAGFIAGDSAGDDSTKQPNNSVEGVIGIQSGVTGIIGHSICSSKFTGEIAEAVENQLDDGTPNTGTIRGFTGTTVKEVAPGEIPASYLDNGVTLYTLCRQL
jgi:prepilin-type N-terminal cleavage/methylation domain-containing protein